VPEHPPWRLRFASHLGIAALDRPLFRTLAGSLDPVAQIRFAAAQGFAGIEDNLLKARPVAEQERIGRALAECGLEMGCFVNNLRSWTRPVLCSDDPDTHALLLRETQRSIEVARRVGGRFLTTLSARDPALPMAVALARMVETLKRLADPVAQAGLVLCLEVTSQPAEPEMLPRRIADAHAVVAAVDSPAVALVFDAFHVQALEGDAAGRLDQVLDRVAVVQVAGHPGRGLLSEGDLDAAGLFALLRRRGFKGLVELEIDLPDGEAAERALLAELAGVNAAL
jgi:hydroxypyruvate isomerase